SSELAEEIARALRQAHEGGVDLGAAQARVAQLERAQGQILDVLSSGAVSDTRALGARLEDTQRDLEIARVELRAAEQRSRAATPSAGEIRSTLRQVAALAPGGDVAYSARDWLRQTLDSVRLTETGES